MQMQVPGKIVHLVHRMQAQVVRAAKEWSFHLHLFPSRLTI